MEDPHTRYSKRLVSNFTEMVAISSFRLFYVYKFVFLKVVYFVSLLMHVLNRV